MKKVLLALLLSFFTLASVAEETAMASFYGPGFHGKKTASGEIFNQNAMTAAHNKFKFGTIVRVYYKNKSVNVRINDTGGFAKYGRQFDLSKGAAMAIGCPGVCKIRYIVVKTPNKPVSN